MRPRCPGSDCALIILLSSSNKAVEEINGYGSCAGRELKGGWGGECAWERVGGVRRAEHRDQSLCQGGKEEGGRGGRKEERRKEERITW